MCSATLHWALHFSHEEMQFLERMNPDTLGCFSDPRQYDAEWKKFCEHPESRPYRVQS